MSIELKNIARLRMYVESTFKGDGTASPGIASYTDVPANEGTIEATITTDEIDPNFTVSSRLEGRQMVLGARRGTLKFVINLAPTGVAAAATIAAPASALTTLLGTVMGGSHAGTGTTFSAGWTAITGSVASAAGLSKGDWIFRINAAGRPEAAQIKNIATNVLTLTHGFSAPPGASDVCYAGTTCHPTEDPQGSLQFLVCGAGTADRWLLVGCQATAVEFAVDPTGKGCPTVTFTFSAAGYKMSNETAGTVTGAIGDSTFTNYSPIVDYQSDMRMEIVGSPTFVTAHSIAVSALAFKPAISFIAVTSPTGGYDGGAPILRWRANRNPKPCEITFTTYLGDNSWWAARNSRTDYAWQYLIGPAPGYLILLAAPTVQVLNPQRSASDGDLQGQTAALNARRNTDTAATTDEAKAPFLVVLA